MFCLLFAGWWADVVVVWVGLGPKIRPDLLPLYFVTVDGPNMESSRLDDLLLSFSP